MVVYKVMITFSDGCTYSSDHVVGVFTTREKAEDSILDWNITYGKLHGKPYELDEFYIVPVTLDEKLDVPI